MKNTPVHLVRQGKDKIGLFIGLDEKLVFTDTQFESLMSKGLRLTFLDLEKTRKREERLKNV